MRNQSLATIVGMCWLLLCSSVSSQEPSAPRDYPSTSGNAFLRLCSVVEKNEIETNQEGQHVVACVAYVEGVVQGVSAEVAFVRDVGGKEPLKPFCLPDNVENGQIIRITLKYIRNHPEEAHQSTVILVVQALREAFPCQAKR